MKQIFSILILLTVTLLADYSKSESKNIVKDSTTNLEWQDTSEQSSKLFTWSNAIKYCEELELDGYTDWRLPNIVELSSIIDDSVNKPQISRYFENNRAGEYWSSTTNAKDNAKAWYVNFNSGIQYYREKSEKYFVRCVRSGD